MSIVVLVRGMDVRSMVNAGLSSLKVAPRGKVVIKPNLISNMPYPTTTDPSCLGEVVRYLRSCGISELIIAEGSGLCNTWEAFRDRGYVKLAREFGVELVDLNNDEIIKLCKEDALALKEYLMPKTIRGAYLISAAVLKVHSITGVTLSLKNMLGATVGGDKSTFHALGIDECIVDINSYRRPDLAIIDGRLANVEGEIGGRKERFGVMIFSEDPVAADSVGARILGRDPMDVRHLRLAHEIGLGIADLEEIELVEIGVGQSISRHSSHISP